MLCGAHGFGSERRKRGVILNEPPHPPRQFLHRHDLDVVRKRDEAGDQRFALLGRPRSEQCTSTLAGSALT